MSHQVIITFDLDEGKIQENAEKEAGRQVAKDVLMEAFGADYNRKNLMKRYVCQAIKEMLEPDKDKIVKEAVWELVDSLRRTKLARNKLAEALDDEDEEGG